MRSVEPGSTTGHPHRQAPQPAAGAEARSAASYAQALHDEALKHDREGRLSEAAHGYLAAIAAAESDRQGEVGSPGTELEFAL